MARAQGPWLHDTLSTAIKTVTSGGTAETLTAAATAAKRVTIQALPDNTNNVAIGDSSVVAAADSTARGIQLAATESYEFDVNDLNKIYVDAVTDGEGVTYMAFN